jgi:hypothetical protein
MPGTAQPYPGLRPDDGQAKLRLVYDVLDGMFGYDVLRCVRAVMTAV